jgi:hypothetical protein
VPALGVFLGCVLALGENEIQRELVPCFLCNPATVPVLAIGQEAFCELVPFTGAIANTGGATAIHVHLVIKEVTLVPFMAWFERVREWGS